MQQPSSASRSLPSHGPRTPKTLVLERSNALLAEARKLVPGVTQSMMKRPEMFCLGSFPVYLAGGQGALVKDVDGNEYIDFITGLGANALGHNHPAVVAAVRESLETGLLHSLPGKVEVEVARDLVNMIPGAEMARFFKTGADATSAAVRLARHATGRDHVVTVGYNGWHDHFMFDTPGVPSAVAQCTTRMPLQSPAQEDPLFELLRERGNEIAVVLLSVPYNRCVTREFLLKLRDLCREQGVRFVLDEVVTGFRLAPGGAQEFYDLQADYVCVSKGLAAGMPLSAVVGPRVHLERMEDLQVSTTFGGELLSLEVCRAALQVYRDTNHIQRAAQLGVRLREGVNQRAEAHGYPLRVLGYDAIPFFGFAPDPAQHVKLAEPFVGAMARRGVLLRRDVNFLCGAHTGAQIDFTIEATESALHEMAREGRFEAQPSGAEA